MRYLPILLTTVVALWIVSAENPSALAVPPNEPTVNHAQPYHYGQPTLRWFERRFEDEQRERNWRLYVQELDELWREYRAAGSTPRAWKVYKWEAAQAKRRYVYEDPYLKPVHRNYPYQRPERLRDERLLNGGAEPELD